MTAFDSLTGLSVGDAFGAQFFAVENRRLLLDEIRRAMVAGRWPRGQDALLFAAMPEIRHLAARPDIFTHPDTPPPTACLVYASQADVSPRTIVAADDDRMRKLIASAEAGGFDFDD